MHTHLEFYNFDSTDCWNPSSLTQLFDPNHTTPFNLTFNLPQQINHLKKIYLKSIEIPVGFTNIRTENNSNTLTISSNKIICTITLISDNYTMNSLITAINNAIIETNIFSGANLIYLPVFSISNQIIIITVPGCSDYVELFFPVQTTLSKVVLGFPYNYQLNLPGNNRITGLCNFNIAYDTYLIMNFPNINAKSTTANNQQISFKIHFNGSANAIFYNVENQSFGQYIELSESNAVIGNLKTTISDKYGYSLNNHGLDWSMTLAFERNLSSHHHNLSHHNHPHHDSNHNHPHHDSNHNHPHHNHSHHNQLFYLPMEEEEEEEIKMKGSFWRTNRTQI